MPSIVVNGTDLRETFGFVPKFGDRVFAPDRTVPTVMLPNRLAPLIAAPYQYTPRSFSAEGWITPRLRTLAARETAERDLTDLLCQGQVVVRVTSDSGVVTETAGVTTEWHPRPHLDRTRAIASAYTWRLLSLEGSWRTPGLQQFAVTGQTTPARCLLPVGTAPSEFSLRIFGPTSSAMTIIFRRFTGDTISTLTITPALTNAETLIVNGGDRTLWKTNPTVSAGAPQVVAFTGDFPPAGISPEDASRVTGQYGTIEVTSTTACTGDIAYPLRWLTA